MLKKSNLPRRPSRQIPTFWSFAVTETCKCGAVVLRPVEVSGRPTLCGTCRAQRVLTIIASRHALIIAAVLLLAGCVAEPSYSPPSAHGYGYAPPYPPYVIQNRNLAAQPGAVELHQGDLAVCK